jgi:hypothetical protein
MIIEHELGQSHDTPVEDSIPVLAFLYILTWL